MPRIKRDGPGGTQSSVVWLDEGVVHWLHPGYHDEWAVRSLLTDDPETVTMARELIDKGPRRNGTYTVIQPGGPSESELE